MTMTGNPCERDNVSGFQSKSVRLTRRDALLSLLAGSSAGVAGQFGLSSFEGLNERHDDAMTDTVVRDLAAVAEVVYPSAVSGIEEFVRTYAGGLPDTRKQKIASAVTELNDYACRTHGNRFADLPVGDRDSVLRAMAVDRTGSSPDGNIPERIRYYVVNQLLYGLYTSPMGSRLLGIENPVGHPGGFESYQKEPSQAAFTAEDQTDE
mgnify:CR=1 FL=1